MALLHGFAGDGLEYLANCCDTSNWNGSEEDAVPTLLSTAQLPTRLLIRMGELSNAQAVRVIERVRAIADEKGHGSQPGGRGFGLANDVEAMRERLAKIPVETTFSKDQSTLNR